MEKVSIRDLKAACKEARRLNDLIADAQEALQRQKDAVIGMLKALGETRYTCDHCSVQYRKGADPKLVLDEESFREKDPIEYAKVLETYHRKVLDVEKMQKDIPASYEALLKEYPAYKGGREGSYAFSFPKEK